MVEIELVLEIGVTGTFKTAAIKSSEFV